MLSAWQRAWPGVALSVGCFSASPEPASPFLTPDASPFCWFRTPGQVLNELDLDNDNMLSFSEFEHAMAKAPDFMK